MKSFHSRFTYWQGEARTNIESRMIPRVQAHAAGWEEMQCTEIRKAEGEMQ